MIQKLRKNQAGAELDLPGPLERQKKAQGAEIDWGTHRSLNLSLCPRSGESAGQQFADLLGQLRKHAFDAGIPISNAVKLTAFAPSEDFAASRDEYKRQLQGLYGDDVPPVSFIGQTRMSGGKAGLEAVLLAPKRDGEIGFNPSISADGKIKTLTEREVERLACQPLGSLAGMGSARYSTVSVGDAKWVFSAGLTGDPASGDAGVRARGALAKEMAILVAEGIFEPGKRENLGLINSHHYVHDIVGVNYNSLNVERDKMYTAFGVKRFPSATGIGMFSQPGDVVMEITGASGVEYEPVLVAAHGEAYQYTKNWLSGQAIGSKGVGTGIGKPVSVPMFSRAVYLPKNDVMIISGTASVEKGKGPLYLPAAFEKERAEKGEVMLDVTEIAESAGIGRLRATGLAMHADEKGRLQMRAGTPAQAQTLVTLRNMTRLLDARGMSVKDMALSRTYIADSKDRHDVGNITDNILGPTPNQSGRGPVCYDGWLVEIEAIAARKKRLF